MSIRLIAGDVETTGVSPTDKVVEIAWIELNEDFNIIDSQRSLINPEMSIPAGSSAVHGITNSHVADSPTIAEFMADNPIDGDALLIAHNAAFDARYFNPWVPDLVGTICTMKMAREVYPDADNHKMQTLKFHLGLEADVAHHEAHTAMGDVKVLIELLRRISADTGWTWVEMFQFCNTPRVVTKMPFGKHKGKTLRDLPRSYIKWLLELDNLDADLRHSLQQL